MDIRKSFETDSRYELEGVTVDIGDGTKLRVARLYNQRHKAALREALKPYKRQLQMGSMDEELSDDILNEIMARTILLGWDGIEENGEPVPYSIEKAKEYLAIKDFRALVMEIAGNMETFRAAAFKDAEKN